MKRVFPKRNLVAKEKVLYLGIDPTNWKREGKEVVHYPVIHTKRLLETLPFNAASYTHFLFTSKRAVLHFLEIATFSLREKTVIAIGPATKETLKKQGIFAIEAKEPTQEGVIALLEELEGFSLFWPHSRKARGDVKKYLDTKKIPYLALPLYDTFGQGPQPIPNLKEFSEVIFTSPSTVDAFFQLFQKIPYHLKLTCIGPITQSRLSSVFSGCFL